MRPCSCGLSVYRSMTAERTPRPPPPHPPSISGPCLGFSLPPRPPPVFIIQTPRKIKRPSRQTESCCDHVHQSKKASERPVATIMTCKSVVCRCRLLRRHTLDLCAAAAYRWPGPRSAVDEPPNGWLHGLMLTRAVVAWVLAVH